MPMGPPDMDVAKNGGVNPFSQGLDKNSIVLDESKTIFMIPINFDANAE